MDSFLKQLAKELAPYLIAELRAANEGDEWADQRSPKCKATLGRNRWCAAVRQRLEADPDDPHARLVGDRYLLDTVGLTEELTRIGKPSVAKPPTPPDPDGAGAARVLQLLQGGK